MATGSRMTASETQSRILPLVVFNLDRRADPICEILTRSEAIGALASKQDFGHPSNLSAVGQTLLCKFDVT